MRANWGQAARYLWASPNTAIGLLLGLAFACGGGRMRAVAGVIEFSGGGLGRLLCKAPPPLRFSAMTLGHVLLGVNEAELARVRAHEHVHVRQYERWGPFFLPAYLSSSLWQWLRGRNPYRDNAFEKEAFAKEKSGKFFGPL